MSSPATTTSGQPSVGTLYVVATPIGNLDDLSFRAVRVLREVKVIACEDTRHTRVLLQRHAIVTPVVSYHEHNEQGRATELIRRLEAGDEVALVSDAGTPLLSDPGYVLIREAIAVGVPVVPIPGPSAITAALSVAGLPTDRFLFFGFLPRKAAERRRALDAVAAVPWTLVFFEAPNRARATLQDLRETLGDRPAALVREATKHFEEILRGSLAEVSGQVQARALRGEVTLVVGGAPQEPRARGDPRKELKRLLGRGMPPTEAVRQVAKAHGLPRREVYDLVVDVRREHPRRKNP